MKKNISAIIIAKDEERMLPDCLKSLGWVDEIVVINNGSIDKTAEIAKKYGAKVIDLPRLDEPNFSQSRNRGLKEANCGWLFYIDADERVDDKLRDEILDVINDPKFSAYAIPRRNFIFGREFKHTGQRPDYVKRLFQKNALSQWMGKLHEEPQFEGGLGHLKASFLHIKHENLSEMVEKTNSWSELEAELMFKANHPPMNVWRFMTAMSREFYLRMFRQMAFLDGPEGIIYAVYQVFSRFTSYAKLWEMQLKYEKSSNI